MAKLLKKVGMTPAELLEFNCDWAKKKPIMLCIDYWHKATKNHRYVTVA